MEFYSNVRTVSVGPEVEVELLMRGEEFLGFGEITVQGVVVRARHVPMRPCVETPEGHTFDRFWLKAVEPGSGGAAVLHLDVLGQPGSYAGGRIDWHYERVPSAAVGPRSAALEIVLEPARLDVDGLDYAGFSYRYVLDLADASAYQLLDKATWELGGRAAGNTIISQSQCCEPEHRCSLDSSFHTWVASARIVENRDEMSFLSYCFTPRFSSMQCFDFLDAAPGSLLMLFERLEHVKGSVFKETGQDVIHHCELHTVGMTSRIETPAKLVLLHRTSAHADHEVRNRWTACRDAVFHRYQRQCGIAEQLPRTQHHTWLDWERDPVFGHHIFHEDAARRYYELGDVVIPAMKEMGFEIFFEGGLYKSLFTENPDQHWPNFTIFDYVISDNFGGLEGLRYLCRKAAESDICVMLWLNLGLGAASPLLAEHPDWMMHDPHLGPYVVGPGFVRALDINNDEVFEYVKDRWTTFIREAGITGIFHDSFPNIGTMKVNFRDPGLQPQYRRLIELVKYFREQGMWYEVEGCSPFAVHHGGLGHTDDLAMGEVVYAWFRGREYSLYRTCRSVHIENLLDGRIGNHDYFRLLANQAPLCIGNGWTERGVILELGDEFAAMQKAYNGVRLQMEKRTLLPDEQGVLWRNGRDDATVAYAFEDIRLPVQGRFHAENLFTGARTDGRDQCCLARGDIVRVGLG